MELMEAIQNRRSIRDYEDTPVPEEKLNKILEAARLSPPARNSQDREFIVVRDGEQRRRLAQAAVHQQHVAQAVSHQAREIARYSYTCDSGGADGRAKASGES